MEEASRWLNMPSGLLRPTVTMKSRDLEGSAIALFGTKGSQWRRWGWGGNVVFPFRKISLVTVLKDVSEGVG